MGKQGPCRHCGVTSTPLWRNGPADKPVLCNACGSRWRTKGSLTNYTPMHAREGIDAEEPRVSKVKPITFKLKEQKPPKKKPNHSIVENEPFSDQNFRKMGEVDTSNRSSSGSAVSYSESCAPHGTADASEMTGSAQSHAWESLVPSKKRTCVTRPKPSPVEKLAKDLYSIMHEQQLSCLSGTSEEDLLYPSETPLGSFEIGYGSVLIRHPNSKSVEEESEASSIPVDKKSYVTSEAYSGSALFVVHSESKGTSNSNGATEKPKKLTTQGTQDNTKRDKVHLDKLQILQNVDSPLVSVDLEDVINYDSFVKYLTNEEQQQLLKFLPPMDTLKPPESLRSMFSSIQFAETLHSYQKLLGEGVFNVSVSGVDVEEWKTLKRLVVTNLTKSKWLECYKQLKEKSCKQTGGKEKTSGSNILANSTVVSLKRPRDTQLQNRTELKGMMRSPKRIPKSGVPNLHPKCSSVPKSSNAAKDFVGSEGAHNLFALPPDKLSMLLPLQYTDDYSDQDLLLEVPLNAPFPEAELLCQPSQQSSVTHSSTSDSGVAEGEACLSNNQPSNFSSKQLRNHGAFIHQWAV